MTFVFPFAARFGNLKCLCVSSGHGLKIHAREIGPRQDFRPGNYDRKQMERARDVIRLARKVLAESDPSILLGGYYKPEQPSESQ